MTIVACPRCHDEVTAPDHASPDAEVRCPLCGEQYALREALSDVPPMLTVVSPGVVPTNGATDLRLAGPVEAARPFVFEERAAPRRPAARARPRRPEKNPVVEMFKVVAGGVVGLTIGQLILWWMPGNWGLSQRDPLGLGQRIGVHVPFLVPASVRGELPAMADLPNDQPAPSTSSSKPARNGGSSANQRPPGRGTDGGPNASRHEQPKPTPPRSPTADSGADNSTSGSSSSPPEPMPLPDPTSGGSPGVRNPPVVPVEDLSARLSAAQLMWEQTGEEERAAMVAPLLAEVAHDVTFIDANDPDGIGVGEAVRSWIAEIAATSDAAAQLAAALTGDNSDKPLAGRIVAGEVVSIESAGQLYETRLREKDDQTSVVLSRMDPSSVLAAGDRVVILGVLVTSPQNQLVGYGGKARSATYGGLVVKQSNE